MKQVSKNVSLSMAYSKKDAEFKLSSNLFQVAAHIAKLFAHLPSEEDEHWVYEIGTFLMEPQDRCTNVATKKGILDKGIVEKEFKLYFSSVRKHLKHLVANPKYTIPKSGSLKVLLTAWEDAEKDLEKATPEIVKVFLTKDKEGTQNQVAALIWKVVEKHRSKLYQ